MMKISQLKEIGRKKISFLFLTVIWSIDILIPCAVRGLVRYLCDDSVSEFVKSPDFFIPTEFVWYIKFLWAIVWAVKLASCFQIYYLKNEFSDYKKTFLPDLLICLLFIIEYLITYYLYILADKEFKISGHSLLLTMTSSMIMFESENNFKITKKLYIKIVFFIILSINLYTFYWTALAFHSFLEITIGTLLGQLSVYIVYIRSY